MERKLLTDIRAVLTAIMLELGFIIGWMIAAG